MFFYRGQGRCGYRAPVRRISDGPPDGPTATAASNNGSVPPTHNKMSPSPLVRPRPDGRRGPTTPRWMYGAHAGAAVGIALPERAEVEQEGPAHGVTRGGDTLVAEAGGRARATSTSEAGTSARMTGLAPRTAQARGDRKAAADPPNPLRDTQADQPLPVFHTIHVSRQTRGRPCGGDSNGGAAAHAPPAPPPPPSYTD